MVIAFIGGILGFIVGAWLLKLAKPKDENAIANESDVDHEPREEITNNVAHGHIDHAPQNHPEMQYLRNMTYNEESHLNPDNIYFGDAIEEPFKGNNSM